MGWSYRFAGEYEIAIVIDGWLWYVQIDYNEGRATLVKSRTPPPNVNYRLYEAFFDNVAVGYAPAAPPQPDRPIEYSWELPLDLFERQDPRERGNYDIHLTSPTSHAAAWKFEPHALSGQVNVKIFPWGAHGKLWPRAPIFGVDDRHDATWIITPRKVAPYDTVDLRFVDLRSDTEWQDVVFRESDLSRAKLNDARFTGCNFEGVNFTDADCAGAKFAKDTNRGNVSRAIFDRTNIRGTDFNHAWMPLAKLAEAKFSSATKFQHADLRKADFRRANLEGADFSYADLRDADFTNANFGAATLTDAMLAGATLDGADLRTVTFAAGHPPKLRADTYGPSDKKTSFRNAKFKAGLLATNWSLLDLTGAIVDEVPKSVSGLVAQYTVFGAIDWTKGQLAGANFAGSDLRTVKFEEADLTDAEFANANMSGMTLKKAILTRVKMAGCDCSDVKFEECTAAAPGSFERDPSKKRTSFARSSVPHALLGMNWTALDLRDLIGGGVFPEELPELKAEQALLHGINLSMKNLEGAVFDHAELRGASLFGSNLKNAFLQHASLQGGDGRNACALSDAFMQSAKLVGANLTGVIATGAYLHEGVDFSQATLSNCDFSNAYMLNAIFSGIGGAAMQGVKFNGACLVNTDFKGVKFSNYGDSSCSFSNACLQGADFSGATLRGTNMTNAAISTVTGDIELTRRTSYKGLPRPTTVEYKVTVINPATATFSTTVCPVGGNGPCIDRMIAPKAPKKWPSQFVAEEDAEEQHRESPDAE
jgi:uncharacterized protein YjbI with pentapeptide repeats